MKKFLILLCTISVCSICIAETETINWYIGDTIYTQTTCETGNDLILPSAPSKPGYNFVGWQVPQYIPLQYLENKPSANSFDTGFIPNYLTKIVATYLVSVNDGRGCAITSTNDNKVYISSWNSNGNYGISGYFLTTEKNKVKEHNISQKHTVSVGKNGFYIDGTYAASFPASSGSAADSLKIFANSPCVLRLFSIQLYQEDVLIHDYVPAMDNNETVCLYDKVTNSFLYNTGSDTVTPGPLLNYD